MSTSDSPLVLSIDDSRTIRMMLRKALEDSGFRVEEADCAEKGIELFKSLHPSLIVMDVEMPGMGGVEGVASIRRLPGGKNIPILMATSLDDLESITKAFNAGATQFITKPVNPNLIGKHIRYMLRSSQAEEDLRKLSAELELRVIERTQQLQDALDTLKNTQSQLVEAEKMAALARIVARVAHEANTPIGIGLTAVSSLNEKFKTIKQSYTDNKITRTEFSEFLNYAHETLFLTESNLTRAAELIKNFKQVSADQTSEERREFALKEYLDKIMISLKPALKSTKLKVNINCPEDISLDSYPGIIFQVVTILVMNSIMHGFDSGQEGMISVSASQEGDFISIQYADTGKGISPENLPKIFEPFFTTKRGAGGVGLGLNIVFNRIVQTLGGTINCSSTPGKGVNFDIKIPRIAKNDTVVKNF